jgi:DNA-binding protein H-NS
MKTYAQIMKQIDTLNDKAEALRRKEAAGVVDRIKEAIRVYGLTASDLGLRNARADKSASAPRRPRGAKKRKSRGPAVVRFRNDAGQVWVGRGPRPIWLREALAAGKKLEDFAV